MSEVRIIGGEWRSRRIQFEALTDLRPTPNRVRETLFNWLQGDIAGARCLELFAGTGVLSIEALSRGASHCTMIDQEKKAVDAINHNLQKLGSNVNSYRCETNQAEAWLKRFHGEPYDLVFLDPPFSGNQAKSLLSQCADLVSPHGKVYVESPTPLSIEELPTGFCLYRQKSAGAVHFALLTRV